MRLFLVGLLLSLQPTVTFAKAICTKPPPPADQIPHAADCHGLIEDLFAISKLEDDERVLWSRNPPQGAGSRKLPFRFSASSVRNNCELLIDALDEDGGDTFSVRDVAIKASDVVEFCLEPGNSGEASVGAAVIGRTGTVAVFVLKKIPLPQRLGGSNRWRAGGGGRTMWQLPLNGSSIRHALGRSSNF